MDKQQQPSEMENLSAARKGIVAAHDLSAGTVLTMDDIMFARPFIEFASGELDLVLGKRLTASVTSGFPIPRNELAE